MSSLCCRALTPICCILLFTIAAGCGCKGEMRRFDVTVSLDKSLSTAGVYPSVEVDVIAVSENDLSIWKDKPVSDFFAPGSTARSDPQLFRSFLLGQDRQEQTLKLDEKTVEELWDKWEKRKVMYLVFLSNYPRIDKPGDDRRRNVVPLTCERWEKDKELRLTVNQEGLKLENTFLPPPK